MIGVFSLPLLYKKQQVRFIYSLIFAGLKVIYVNSKNIQISIIFAAGADKKDGENLQKFGEESQKPVSC